MSLPDSVAKLRLIDPYHANAVVEPRPRFIGGYPLPGPQSISGTATMSKTGVLVDDNTWRILAEHGHFDDIVVGSGFCALAYISTALERNPHRKILLLERGGFWLQDHVQNLPAPFQFVRGHHSETFPWELSYETAGKAIYLSGSSPFFGGRSSFWSIWSPRARDGDMRDFPECMKDTARTFYDKAEHVLHVQSADQITDPVFTAIGLQGWVTRQLNANPVDGASSEPAMLATGLPLFGPSSNGYRHFSAIASLLTLNERQNTLAAMKEGSPLMIATDTIVERFEVEQEIDEQSPRQAHARVLHTSRGPLTLHGGKTNVILAAGAIPNTTILLNSIEEPAFQKHAGQRLTAHFRSQVMARFEADPAWFDVSQEQLQALQHPVISAHHVRGTHKCNGSEISLQWHIQLHGTYIPPTFQQHYVQEIQGMIPDLWSAPTSQQLESSGGYVVLSASVLGELPEASTSTDRSRLQLVSGGDVTKNIRLHLNLGKPAEELWAEMVKKTFKTVSGIANGNPTQFWNYKNSKWQSETNPKREDYSKTVKPLFHEASTTYMAEKLPKNPKAPEDSASVDTSYRPMGLAEGNVYVTGAGLFPTAGSWNPTLTICALAQHLATTLVEDTYLGRAAFNCDSQTYFFNNEKYVKINCGEDGELKGELSNVGKAHPSQLAQWGSLWRAGFRQIDVILVRLSTTSGDQQQQQPVPELYVFSGTRYARIKYPDNNSSIHDSLIDGNVRLIKETWPSLPYPFTTALCGVLIDPNDPARVFFFSGHQYVDARWTDTENQSNGGLSAANISDKWGHIPSGRKFNRIFPHPTNKSLAYLFSGTEFWMIDVSGPTRKFPKYNIADSWPSLLAMGFI